MIKGRILGFVRNTSNFDEGCRMDTIIADILSLFACSGLFFLTKDIYLFINHKPCLKFNLHN